MQRNAIQEAPADQRAMTTIPRRLPRKSFCGVKVVKVRVVKVRVVKVRVVKVRVVKVRVVKLRVVRVRAS